MSTLDVASVVGIGRATLERWLRDGRIRAPQTIRIGRRRFRLWTNGDLEAIREYKASNYRKKPRRKKVGRTKTKKSKP
jgi:excisionase family DNA binding protein